MKALIVEHGFSRAALAGARALAAGGWQVGVGAPRSNTLATASNAVAHSHWVPNPTEDPARFVGGIRDAVDEQGYEVVFGADDAEVVALSALRVGIPPVVPHAPHAAVLRALDKIDLTQAAEAAGIRCPRTELATDDALLRIDGPVVIKGRTHAEVGPGPGARQEASIEAGAEAAARRAHEIRLAGGEPIVQEAVLGDLMALVCLADRDGSLVSFVQQETAYTCPPRTGVTVRGRTVAADPALVERAAALLRELGWFGIAELQFMRPPGGEPHLIDLNGRFYGSLSLALASGPNLPAAWGALALDRPFPRLEAARPGVRYHWLEGDIRRAARERRGGLVRDLAGCLRYALGATHSITSLRDMRPALQLGRELAARAADRLRPRAG